MMNNTTSKITKKKMMPLDADGDDEVCNERIKTKDDGQKTMDQCKPS